MIFVSLLPYAYAVNRILVPHNIVSGGLTGVCEIIYFATNGFIPIWLSVLAINIILLLVAFRIQGLGTDQNTAEGERWIKRFTDQGKNGLAAEYTRVYIPSAPSPTPVPPATSTPVPAPEPTAAPITFQSEEDFGEDTSWAWDSDPETMVRVLGFDTVLDAALAGDLDAAYALGYCYHYGLVISQSDAEAFSWFLRVAQEGMPGAYTWVGDAYFYGQGTAQDYTEAAEWYREAAEEGSGYAMYMLGRMYREGLGVRQDDRRADRWLGDAAEAGYTGDADDLPAIDIDPGDPARE